MESSTLISSEMENELKFNTVFPILEIIETFLKYKKGHHINSEKNMKVKLLIIEISMKKTKKFPQSKTFQNYPLLKHWNESILATFYSLFILILYNLQQCHLWFQFDKVETSFVLTKDSKTELDNSITEKHLESKRQKT